MTTHTRKPNRPRYCLHHRGWQCACGQHQPDWRDVCDVCHSPREVKAARHYSERDAVRMSAAVEVV